MDTWYLISNGPKEERDLVIVELSKRRLECHVHRSKRAQLLVEFSAKHARNMAVSS